jgi:hypothetical protein
VMAWLYTGLGIVKQSEARKNDSVNEKRL